MENGNREMRMLLKIQAARHFSIDEVTFFSCVGGCIEARVFIHHSSSSSCIVMSRPWRMRERSLRAWRTAPGRCEQLGSAEGLLKEALQVL